jgi:hypothetical protein
VFNSIRVKLFVVVLNALAKAPPEEVKSNSTGLFV